jgi:hypothetical protein
MVDDDDDLLPWDGLEDCYVCGKYHDPINCGICDKCGDYHPDDQDCMR